MKKILFILLLSYAGISFSHAQKKSYLSIENGFTGSGMSNRIADNMKSNGFGHFVEDELFFFLFVPIKTSTQYPVKDPGNVNYKFRYGYDFKKNRSVEVGYGHTYDTRVTGADISGGNVNYLNMHIKLNTAYAAYMFRNARGNAAIGAGPAVSFGKVEQGGPFYYASPSSVENVALPGVIMAAYWNFVNKNSWFMGLRTDMIITTPIKTGDFTITNSQDPSFVSHSKSISVGAIMNTFSLSAGIKF